MKAIRAVIDRLQEFLRKRKHRPNLEQFPDLDNFVYFIATPVPVKNSIRPTVTQFERHGDTLTDRVAAQPSSTTASRDDPRPRCLGLRPRPPRHLSSRLP